MKLDVISQGNGDRHHVATGAYDQLPISKKAFNVTVLAGGAIEMFIVDGEPLKKTLLD